MSSGEVEGRNEDRGPARPGTFWHVLGGQTEPRVVPKVATGCPVWAPSNGSRSGRWATEGVVGALEGDVGVAMGDVGASEGIVGAFGSATQMRLPLRYRTRAGFPRIPGASLCERKQEVGVRRAGGAGPLCRARWWRAP